MRKRDSQGRYKSKKTKKPIRSNVCIEHNYSFTDLCDGIECNLKKCPSFDHFDLGSGVSRSGWREGRRLVELSVLLKNLEYCRSCKYGPIPLTFNNIVGELQKGLSGYLYVVCQNPDCNSVNRVAYGKTHHIKSRGMPCFDVNTKLGTAMIDSLGGPVKVNNFLAALNLKPISNRNLKKMEERAGEIIEELAVESTRQAAVDAFEKEMKDVACLEMQDAQKCMEADIDDLGVSLLPDESPSLRLRLQAKPSVIEDTDWSDDETNGADEDIVDVVNHILPSTSSPRTR